MKRIVLAILLLAFAGCASRPRVAPTVERRKEDLLQGLSRSYERLRNMRGRGRIAVSTGGNAYSGNFSLLYENPAKLRIDVHGPFGIELLALSTVEDSILAVLPLANMALVSRRSTPGIGGLGDVVTANMLREFVTATLGAATHLRPDEVKLERREGLEVLIFEESGLLHEISVKPGTSEMLARSVLKEKGRLLVRCDYERFKLTQRALRPYVVKLAEGGTKNNLTMTYEYQSLNGRVRDGEFELVVPKGIEAIQDQ